MRTLAKKIEEKRIWTVGIGDDRVMDCMGEWGTTQNALDYYRTSLIEDLMTYEEAKKRADELNEGCSGINKHYVLYIGKAKINLSEI